MLLDIRPIMGSVNSWSENSALLGCCKIRFNSTNRQLLVLKIAINLVAKKQKAIALKRIGFRVLLSNFGESGLCFEDLGPGEAGANALAGCGPVHARRTPNEKPMGRAEKTDGPCRDIKRRGAAPSLG